MIIPQDVSLTILKGAVLFGLDPTIVNVRRSRLTYGVSVLNRFVHDYHPIEKKIVKDKVEWCADIFEKFVLVDQSISLGDIVLRKYTPARQNQAQCIISFYCSESDKPIYVTDPGVRKIGKLSLNSSCQHLICSAQALWFWTCTMRRRISRCLVKIVDGRFKLGWFLVIRKSK